MYIGGMLVAKYLDDVALTLAETCCCVSEYVDKCALLVCWYTAVRLCAVTVVKGRVTR